MNATPQGLDRDALAKLLYGRGLVPADRVREIIDKIFALVRPVEGVVLTPEEAAAAAACVRAVMPTAYMRDDLAALVSRLEAAQ